MVRLRPNIDRKPLPIITLAQDTSTITACSNDYSFEKFFLGIWRLFIKWRYINNYFHLWYVEKYYQCIKLCKKKKNIFSISLLGNKGGKAKNLTNIPIVVPSKNVARIQECHIFIGHIILEWVEDQLIKTK